MFDKRLSPDWEFSATAGAGLNDRTVNSLRIDSKTASLYFPNVFNVANIVMNGSAYVDEQIDARRQTQSLFATASFKYAGSLNFEVRDATTGHRRSPTPPTKAAGSSIIRQAHRG